jgi:hypothetical protein
MQDTRLNGTNLRIYCMASFVASNLIHYPYKSDSLFLIHVMDAGIKPMMERSGIMGWKAE